MEVMATVCKSTHIKPRTQLLLDSDFFSLLSTIESTFAPSKKETKLTRKADWELNS